VDEIRPATALDVPAIAALYRSLSPHSARMRFSCPLPEERVVSTAALGPDVFGVVGLHGDRVVGEARCCCGDEVPEMAVTVADDHQGFGLGPRLLRALRTAARDRGFERLSAVVRTDNRDMIRVLQKIGCVIVEPVRDGVVIFEIATDELMPGWGEPDGRRRVLVESSTLFDDAATEELREAGYDVRRCFVGRKGTRPCPLLRLGRCRLAEGADVVACLLPQADEEGRAIAARHAAGHRLGATSMAGWRGAVPDLLAETHQGC
jgi:GNAT superfamily N-acetyltransferase